ncbi:MAG TPA: DUF58 domain-containing protein, partial [Chloroflexia bacterium]|nr:DUF58 domain-containing protein [Chloroflexia bacterium]
ALLHGLIGAHPARRRTAGIEFADYRPYTPGDDLRRVDWNAYARLGSLQIRQAQAEHETVLGLLVDASPSMTCGRPPKLLLARRLAAALGYIALAHLDGVLLAAPGTPLATSDLLRGQPGTLTLFAALEGLTPGRTAPFDEVLSAWSGRLGPGRGVVILSDLLLDGYRDGVRRLVATGARVTVLHVLAPDDLHPGPDADLELVDSETGALQEITLDAATRGAYEAAQTAWRAEIAAWCAAQGAGYLLVESDWDAERVLLETLRRQGVTR